MHLVGWSWQLGCVFLTSALTQKTSMCMSMIFFSLKVNVLVMADQHLVAAVKAFRNCFPGGPESHKFLVADPDVLVEKPRGTVLGAAAAAEKNDNFFSTKCNRQSLP